MSDLITEGIIGAAIEVHKILGPGLLECIYEDALCIELAQRKIEFQRQMSIDIVYKNCRIKGQRIDLLVAHEVVVEVKAVTNLAEVVMAQVLSYLKAARLKRALLINFGVPRLVDGIKRISL